MGDRNATPMLTSEVGRALGVSANTVRVWRKTGRLVPVAVTSSGVAFYTRDEVERVRRAREREERE